MNKVKLLFSACLLLIVSTVSGQAEKTISKMKAGTVLTESDIGFLSMVANAKIEAKNRGSVAPSATIAGVKYTVGSKLTSTQAKSINAAVKAFQKTYKAPDASRGDGLCYYWYYYCDGWGYCYWYKYYYYC